MVWWPKLEVEGSLFVALINVLTDVSFDLFGLMRDYRSWKLCSQRVYFA